MGYITSKIIGKLKKLITAHNVVSSHNHVSESPLHAELLSVEQLKRLAGKQALEHEVVTVSGRNELLPRLDNNADALRKAHDILEAADSAGHRLSPPEEWLLDNYYLIEQQIEIAKIHLPKQYSHRLPRLKHGEYTGLPRVYCMAAELIAHLDGLLDRDAIAAYLSAYQAVEALNLGELWAVPISLRLAIIENLRRVAVLIAERRKEMNNGIYWAKRVLNMVETEPKRMIHLLAELADTKQQLKAPFLNEFVGRLQSHGPAVAIFLNWIDQALQEESTTLTQCQQRDGHAQAAEHLTVTNSITSLRFLGSMDWKEFVEEQSRVEKILRQDPSGAYILQDFATCDHYRHTVEKLAKRSGRPEVDVAKMALEQAAVASLKPGCNRSRHVGSHLIGGDRFAFRKLVGCPWSPRYALGLLLRRYRLFFYLSAVVGITLFIAGWPAWLAGMSPMLWRFWIAVAVAFIPASALALSLVNFVVTARVAPHPLPRLDFSKGIPEEHRTMVVVPTLLTNKKSLKKLLESLEIHYLGNRDPNIFFALLTDFTDAQTETLPADAELLEQACQGITTLNERYPNNTSAVFSLYHRPRVYNPHEGCWMGYERKRGKLEQFNALLRGEGTAAFSVKHGNQKLLPTIRYVITLDSDTFLPRKAANIMIGAMAHPLNRPRYDANCGRIVEGYAILQPRVSIQLTSANNTLYSRLSCGELGLDPYSREFSDVYQDLFSEGSFVGKGIYDVDAFRQSLEKRFPENLILSHDLIESGYARSGLLGCVEVYEDIPASYLDEASRQHRWMRGDWQITQWLGIAPPTHADMTPCKQPVSKLTQWKILDNLRRCLVAPSMVFLIIIAWLADLVNPGYWILFVLLVLGLTGVVRSITLLLRKPRERGMRLHLRTWVRALLRHSAQPLFALSVLPYEAWISLCAFSCSAVKMPFTRRGLLIWHLGEYRRRSAKRTLTAFYGEMWTAPVMGVVIVGLALSIRPNIWLTSLPLAVLWILAPFSAWFVSCPLRQQTPRLTTAQHQRLRLLACTTWRFFEKFVSIEDNWLPPDNFQEVPNPMIASRTSPTNIGFSLVSTLTAWDFGYISTSRMVKLLSLTFNSLEKLECYRGHLYNWYDTRTLQPLQPRYVSSVDSGNLAACLVALRVGLQELAAQPAIPPQIWSGTSDALGAITLTLRKKVSSDFMKLIHATELLLVALPDSLHDQLERMKKLTGNAEVMVKQSQAETCEDAASWCIFFRDICQDHLVSLEKFASLQTKNATLRQVSQLAPDNQASHKLIEYATEILKKVQLLIEQCHQLQSAMDFRFLYDTQQELLSIGFDVESRRLDLSRYDLLASEARIASFLMIAEEQLPLDHWFALGRLLAGRGGAAALVSWSGSMFEYLMPSLFMTSYPGTLLDKTSHSVIKRQIRYGKQRNIPWGISESCYHATDAQHVYQYRAFGVPGLGLKRGLSDDLVVAPYATLLALPFHPVAACANLDRLINREGALGAYGLIEAIDYTPSRIPRGKQRAEVRCFMTHHQGMGLLAISHLLLDAPMVRRFMSEPTVRATEVLLQERIPDVSPAIFPHRREAASTSSPEDDEQCDTMRSFQNPNLHVPEVHLLSNGKYHVMVNQAGGSSTYWQGLQLTRWREDITCDNWGVFLYLRDIKSNSIWSNAFQPVCKPGKNYTALFTQGHAEYRRTDFEIETKTEICVSPEDNVDIRRITLTNQTRQERHLELTSYAELVLAPPAADLAHRAFSNLFVQTEILPCGETILCTRHKREEHEKDIWYFQKLCVAGERKTPSCECDRERFIGRNRTLANPIAMEGETGTAIKLSNSSGAVLDPIAAVRHQVVLSDEPLHIHLISGVAATREEAMALAEKYRDRHFIERAFDMAWSHSQIIMRILNISETEAQIYGRLASSMLYTNPRNRAPWTIVASNRTGQQGLWRFGISGELPIILLRISDIRQMELVTDVLRAHAYWHLKGLQSDLVILNEDFSGYRATLNDRIIETINTSPYPDLLDKPGGIFLRRIENLSEEDLILFQSVARVVLVAGAENLREQVERRYIPHHMPPLLTPEISDLEKKPIPLEPRQRSLVSGAGGFSPDGKEYVIMLEPGMNTPAPWSNVIAGKRLGMVVSESGSIYTWVDNAHEYRLTTWHNDPVSDPCSEAFYLRDEQSGNFWSLTPQPAPGRNGYVCRHGFGYTTFEHHEAELSSEFSIYAALHEPLRCVAIKLTNNSGRTRRLSLTAFQELVMGEWRHLNMMHIHTEIDTQTGMLLAHNPYSRTFPQRLVFAACSETEVMVSGDRTEFIGRNSSLSRPAAMLRQNLSGRTGARYDPAVVLQGFFRLAPQETREVVFIFGAADTVEEARTLRKKYGGPLGARTLFEKVNAYWKQVLGTIQVDIPDQPAVNMLMNGWLVYQTLGCRILGRSGFYQSGGAYGFRDQLQDAMALLHAAPEVLKEQILAAAACQFEEGDVLHWWHPPTGAGVRTRITDDRLWLPQATARYINATGDYTILDEVVPFITARPLSDGEESRYDQHFQSNQGGTLYEHCLRAIRITLSYGKHGIPLIGGGDWNDGMNRVGLGGKGESVWMAWFLGDTLRRFAPLAKNRGDHEFAELCQHEREALIVHTEDSAWDGEWYRRAYFDDGTPIGSAKNDECHIDAISQSWSVLSGMGRSQNTKRAMRSVYKHLVKKEHGLILLLTPPFVTSEPDPGYIRCYPPGVRENGGQYTHAAIWTAMAFAKLGEADIAWELFQYLNPVIRTKKPETMEWYRVEPYVMSADIYGAEPHTGRGGWSWYTGAAGWMYRLTLETLLGLKRNPEYLTLTPCLPADGPNAFTIRYQHHNHVYHIEARRATIDEKPQVLLDGIEQPDQRIPLWNDNSDHQVIVIYNR